MTNYKNVIYILTNPLYAGYVKIGYASDLYSRLASLNTGMLRNFEPYAVYETPVKNADKQFHAIIDDLAPIVRARVINGQKIQDKEFFKLEPEQAYDILQHIAMLTGTENRLHRAQEEYNILPNVPPYNPTPIPTNIPSRSSPSIHPNTYNIGSTSYSFSTWKETLINHCEVIVANVGFSMFKATVLNLKVGKSAKKSPRRTFAETEEEMRGFSFYKFSQGDLYLLTNYSSDSIKKIHAALNELYPQFKFNMQQEAGDFENN